MSGATTDRLPALGDLDWAPALDHPELLADPVAAALLAWSATQERVSAEVAVAAIDPDHTDTDTDTETLNAVHGLPPEASANCVVVSGRRGDAERVAACVVTATTRADVNTLVRKLLDARNASFLPTDRATDESGMEYGGITPVGLPTGWRVLVDDRFTAPGALALMGSGLRRSKLLMPGDLLCAAPWVEVVAGLGVPRG